MKHKKSIVSLILIFIYILSTTIIGCTNNSNNNNLEEVKLCEVVRSVFYAPIYIAINEGFFEEEGLHIDLSTGQGADKVMQTVLTNNADIGFCGPEQVIYINNTNRENYPILFAQLTQKDGSFLVGRHKEENFSWNSLKNKDIIGGRPGGIPEMALEYVLNNNNLDPKKDVNMVTNLDFTATAGAFKSGTGDYVALFEPTASMLVAEGDYSIVASIGESSGNIAYTAFFCTKSYMNQNPDILNKFTKAIKKAQDWYHSHSSEEIANSIKSFFPGTDQDIMINVIDNYKKIDALCHTPKVSEEGLDNLVKIIQAYDSSLIPREPDYNKIIKNDFAN